MQLVIHRNESLGDIDAELLDVSRHGICLRVDQQLEIGERVVVNLHDPLDGFAVEFSATVRWRQPDGDALITVGCEFDETMGWESIGELFLRGALQSDENP